MPSDFMTEAYFLDGTAVPVRTIFCVGRNYAAHARELNHPVPEEPVIFTKPDTTIIHNGDQIVLPASSQDVQHEVELVVLLGEGGRHIGRDDALRCVAGYAIGVDVTARDLQTKARTAGEPWTISKGFDTFAPISDFVPVEDIPDPQALGFTLSVNGEIRQRGKTADMLFSVADVISYLSNIFYLRRGDLIFTGTPSGVGPLAPGDELDAVLLPDRTRLQVSVIAEAETTA